MFWKLTVVIIVATAVAAGLLALRQQRFELAHDLVQGHHKIDRLMQTNAALDVKLAPRLEKHSLEDSIARAQLKLEPLVPVYHTGVYSETRVAQQPRRDRHGG
jgi:hypothetical protein